jgi:hypothetical protein
VPLLGHRLALLSGPWAAPFSNLAHNLFGSKPAAAAAAAAAGQGPTMLLQIGPASVGRQLAAAGVVDVPEDGAAIVFTADPVVVAELLARQVCSSSSSSVATSTSCHSSSTSSMHRQIVRHAPLHHEGGAGGWTAACQQDFGGSSCASRQLISTRSLHSTACVLHQLQR